MLVVVALIVVLSWSSPIVSSTTRPGSLSTSHLRVRGLHAVENRRIQFIREFCRACSTIPENGKKPWRVRLHDDAVRTLFGLNEIAVRLTTVISSIVLLCVIYALCRPGSRSGPYSRCRCVALMGWVFLLSRYGDALIASALASTCAMWMLIRSTARKRSGTAMCSCWTSRWSFCFSSIRPVQSGGRLCAVGLAFTCGAMPLRQVWNRYHRCR